MLKRLIVGLVLGGVIGAVVAAVLVQGLGWATFPMSTGVFAYLAAAVTGVVTGLVAGKPIWSADGKIEAGLKAFFGVLLGLGGMFALRTWAKIDLDLDSLKAGHGFVGDLPAVSLPLIAMLLAGFYELDNSGSSEKKEEEAKGGGAKKESGKKVRVAEDEEEAEEEEEEQPAAKKKAR
jgi:hypothetical protein